jgi:hypothetical protein
VGIAAAAERDAERSTLVSDGNRNPKSQRVGMLCLKLNKNIMCAYAKDHEILGEFSM